MSDISIEVAETYNLLCLPHYISHRPPIDEVNSLIYDKSNHINSDSLLDLLKGSALSLSFLPSLHLLLLQPTMYYLRVPHFFCLICIVLVFHVYKCSNEVISCFCFIKCCCRD